MKKKPEETTPIGHQFEGHPEPLGKKKRSPNKTNVLGLIKSLDANAIRARLADLESEQAALKALLTVAEARDKKDAPPHPETPATPSA